MIELFEKVIVDITNTAKQGRLMAKGKATMGGKKNTEKPLIIKESPPFRRFYHKHPRGRSSHRKPKVALASSVIYDKICGDLSQGARLIQLRHPTPDIITKETLLSRLSVIESNPYGKYEKINRKMLIMLYFSEGKNRNDIITALNMILMEFGMLVAFETERRGSLFKKIIAITKNKVTKKTLDKGVDNLAEHLENITLNKSRIENDTTIATAVALLVSATPNDESVYFFATFLVVRTRKDDGEFKTIAKTLTTTEHTILTMHPSFIERPKSLIKNLALEVKRFDLKMSSLKDEDFIPLK